MPHVLYRIDVQQGNVVTDEMLETLKPGMTKSQVRFVLGSPLVVDAFRDNRWDYLYIQREKGDLIEQKRLTVYFQDGRLARVEKEQLFSHHSDHPKLDTIIGDSEKAEFDSGEFVGNTKKVIEAGDLDEAVETTEKTIVDPREAAEKPEKLIDDVEMVLDDDIEKTEDSIEEAADLPEKTIEQSERIVEEPQGVVEKMSSEPEKPDFDSEKTVQDSRKELIIPKRTTGDLENTVDEAMLMRRRPCDSSKPPFHPRMKQLPDETVLEQKNPCFDK